MKKVLFSFLIVITLFSLTGCGNEIKNPSEDNSNNQQQTETYNLTSFESDIKNLVLTTVKTETLYSMIGATDGYKIYDSEEQNSRLEVYKYDSSSDTYKKAEENQKLYMGDTEIGSAIVKNGYALIIDDEFPNKTEIVNLFNKLK